MTSLATRADKTRIPLPPAAELYARMRRGESSADLARQYGCGRAMITQAVRDSGIADQLLTEKRRAALLATLTERSDHTWQDDAARTGHDPAWWFPTSQPGPRQDTPETVSAKRICAACPVAAQCAKFADETKSVGIWAGAFRSYR